MNPLNVKLADEESEYLIYRAMSDEACSFFDIEDEPFGIPIFDAIIEGMEQGFVLRKFEGRLMHCYYEGDTPQIYADLDDEERDKYTAHELEPILDITEVYREYWYEGKTYYYQSHNGVDWIRMSKEGYIKAVDGDPYYIINYDGDYNPMTSGSIEEILYENPTCKTFIDTIARGSYRAFRTLSKYGFTRLSEEFIYVPHLFANSDKISEVLGLDYNQVIAYMSAGGISGEDILSMRELAEARIKFTDINVCIMAAMRYKAKIFDYVTPAEMRKTFKYLRNQISRRNNYNTSIAVGDYADYLDECHALGYDLSQGQIRYPTDLRVAHLRTAGMVEVKKNADMEENLKYLYDKYSRYIEWTDGEHEIVMPSSCADIIREGKVQHHCVGGYAERMARGEDLILFVRKCTERDMPFYTVELKPFLNKYILVQCRGYENNDSDKTVRAQVDAFLSKYAEWYNSRPCDIKLEAQRIYYKAVKKTADGRYISAWDNKTEYRIGEVISTSTERDPDRVAVKGIHIASLDFAEKYGDNWQDAAILEIQVDMKDLIVPNAKDQVRTSKGKVLREVPMSELGEWGARHERMREVA